MTNHWKDIKNADVVLVMGANPAENHPCGFKWALEARDERLAKLVTIDPRFTRTSAVADKHLQIRPGSDIAILGGFIKYILDNDLQHDDYVRLHTNASFVVGEAFGFAEGLFAGFDEASNRYDKTAWEYERGADGYVRRDPTLEHPRCVFQLLKQHYARYTPDIAAQIAGCSEEEFLAMAEIVCSTGRADRVGTIMYAVGWTMHTVGCQIIRTAAILQLLLGNIGRPGGGSMRCADMPTYKGDRPRDCRRDPARLFEGANSRSAVFSDPSRRVDTPPARPRYRQLLGELSKFYVSLMKAWFGDHATSENDFAYDYLAKPAGDATWLSLWDEAFQGRLEGFIALGFNVLLAGPDVPRLLRAMSRLKWQVVIDPFMLDSAEFWKAPGQNPAEIETEVLYLPSSHWIERDGSFTNSGRWAQWKEKAVDVPIGVRSDTWILSELFWRVKELYQQDEDPVYNDPIQHLTWNYLNPREPTLVELAKEINGYDLNTGRLLSSFGELRDDGSTTSGNWLYCASYTEAGNQMANRGTADPTNLGMHHDWGFSWPLNRRVLYNRASADADGRPWDPQRAGIAWTGREWVGDVPDYGPTTPPGAAGAFIMTEEGVARLFSVHLNDGPFSEHYEPVESPTTNVLHEDVPVNPVIRWYDGVRETLAGDGDEYPYACTVYRVVEREHFVTSNVPYLVEAMPDFFVEVPEGLAQEKGIANASRVRVWSKRGSVEGTAIVTKRIKPLRVNGKIVWTVGIPVHWGFVGLTTGSMANQLTPFIGDANTGCPEFKSFLVNLEKA